MHIKQWKQTAVDINIVTVPLSLKQCMGIKLLAVLTGKIYLKCHFYPSSYSCQFTLPLSVPKGGN